MDVKTCPKCNRAIPYSASTCPRCGHELGDSVTSPAPEPTSPTPPTPSKPNPQNNRNKKLAVIVAIVIALGIVIRFSHSMWTLTNIDTQSDSKPAETETSQDSTSKSGDEATKPNSDTSMDSTMSPQMREYLYTNRSTREEIKTNDLFTSDDHSFSLYGMSELDGMQLVALLASNGYLTDRDQGGNACWRDEKNNEFLVLQQDEDGSHKALEPGDVNQFLQGAKGQAVFFREGIPAGDCESAYQALLHCSHNIQFAEQTELSSQNAAAWFEASNGKKYFARCMAIDSGYLLDLYPESFCDSSVKEAYDHYVDSTIKELSKQLDDSSLPATVTEACFDEHGWVTDYAFMELSGADLVQALEAKGYTFVPLKEYSKFKSLDGKCEISFDNGEKHLTEEEIVQLGPNGGGEPICCLIANTGYSSNQEAFESMQTATLLDYWGSTKAKLADVWGVVSSDSVSQDLINLYVYPEGTWQLRVFPSDAVASEVFTLRGIRGTTIEEMWQYKTKGAIGDYMQAHPLEWQ